MLPGSPGDSTGRMGIDRTKIALERMGLGRSPRRRGRSRRRCGRGWPASSACPACWRLRPARWRRSCCRHRASLRSNGACWLAILGADRIREDKYERAFHARGRSYHDLLRLRAGDLASAPDAVVYPRCERGGAERARLRLRTVRRRRAIRRRHQRGRRRDAAARQPQSGAFGRSLRHGSRGEHRCGVVHRDGRSRHRRTHFGEGAAGERVHARPFPAILRVLHARRLDRASRRGTDLQPLRQGGGLAGRRRTRDTARHAAQCGFPGIGRRASPDRSCRRLRGCVRHRYPRRPCGCIRCPR